MPGPCTTLYGCAVQVVMIKTALPGNTGIVATVIMCPSGYQTVERKGHRIRVPTVQGFT